MEGHSSNVARDVGWTPLGPLPHSSPQQQKRLQCAPYGISVDAHYALEKKTSCEIDSWELELLNPVGRLCQQNIRLSVRCKA